MPKKENKKKDECIQLKNINYQSMLQKKNAPIDSGKIATEDINKYLEQEQNKGNRQHKAWSKLEKGLKQKKLYGYIEKISKKHNLSVKEVTNLKKYIKTQLERKKLQRIKDVIYDSVKGTIKDIPGLKFNNENRKFILRKVDKKGSTLKSLAPKNSAKRKSQTKRRKKSDKRKSQTERKKRKKKTIKTNNKIDKHLKE
jgi:hypothetical protein